VASSSPSLEVHSWVESWPGIGHIKAGPLASCGINLDPWGRDEAVQFLKAFVIEEHMARLRDICDLSEWFPCRPRLWALYVTLLAQPMYGRLPLDGRVAVLKQVYVDGNVGSALCVRPTSLGWVDAWSVTRALSASSHAQFADVLYCCLTSASLLVSADLHCRLEPAVRFATRVDCLVRASSGMAMEWVAKFEDHLVLATALALVESDPEGSLSVFRHSQVADRAEHLTFVTPLFPWMGVLGFSVGDLVRHMASYQPHGALDGPDFAFLEVLKTIRLPTRSTCPSIVDRGTRFCTPPRPVNINSLIALAVSRADCTIFNTMLVCDQIVGVQGLAILETEERKWILLTVSVSDSSGCGSGSTDSVSGSGPSFSRPGPVGSSRKRQRHSVQDTAPVVQRQPRPEPSPLLHSDHEVVKRLLLYPAVAGLVHVQVHLDLGNLHVPLLEPVMFSKDKTFGPPCARVDVNRTSMAHFCALHPSLNPLRDLLHD
jgi:hypothetical protein